MFVGSTSSPMGLRGNLSETNSLTDLLFSDLKALKQVIDPVLAIPWDQIRVLERRMMMRTEHFCVENLAA